MEPEKSIWFKALIQILGIVAVFTMLLWWIPLFWGIGLLLQGDIQGALTAFVICALMGVIYKGTDKLFEHLGIGKD